MKLYLQMGYGMIDHSKKMIQSWGEGTVILSPRDMTLEGMKKLSTDLKKFNGRVLLDPQFYIPRADHKGLMKHDYWPAEYKTIDFSVNGIRNLLACLYSDYNVPLETPYFILPGCYHKSIDEDWETFHKNIINIAQDFKDRPIIATLSLSAEVLQSEESIQKILNYVEDWNVDGFYVVPEHPKGDYLVNESMWLVNLMDLCAGLKLMGKIVFVGYCNHQELCLSLCKVDAIATGTFLNVRNFSLDKFNMPDEDEIGGGGRSTWYYCPQALSEFQVSFLDTAKRVGILELLKTDPSLGSKYSDVLFSGARPTDTDYTETEAFRHYFQCLKVQVEQSTRGTYQETLDGLSIQLTAAEHILEELHEKGVRGKKRDFSEMVDTNLSAISAFNTIRGFVMSRNF